MWKQWVSSKLSLKNSRTSQLREEDVKKVGASGSYKDLYDPDGDYKLLLENGKEVNTLPGTSVDFVLWKYKYELGKDYKRIVFYLCQEMTTICRETKRW